MRMSCKFLVFAVLVVALHLLVTFYIYPPTPAELVGDDHLDTLDALHKAMARDMNTIVYFADSVNFCYAPTDRDQRRVSDMMMDHVAGLSLCTVDHKAYHLGIYRAALAYLERMKWHPAVVVLPVNLRSFTTHWTLRPSWQFVDLQRWFLHDSLWYPVVYRPCKIFKLFDFPLTQENFGLAPVYSGREKAGRIKDFENSSFDQPDDEKTEQKITLFYMQEVDERNTRVAELREAVRTLRRLGSRVIVYILPVDYRTCDRFMDGRFSAQIKRNADYVEKVLREEGLNELHNFAFSLDPDCFYYRSPYPDEHLNEKGRSLLGKRLADIINHLDTTKPGR